MKNILILQGYKRYLHVSPGHRRKYFSKKRIIQNKEKRFTSDGSCFGNLSPSFSVLSEQNKKDLSANVVNFSSQNTINKEGIISCLYYPPSQLSLVLLEYLLVCSLVWRQTLNFLEKTFLDLVWQFGLSFALGAVQSPVWQWVRILLIGLALPRPAYGLKLPLDGSQR